MTTGMLQEPLQTSPSGMGPRFRPYASSDHNVTKGRYITSNDPRGYIPVYEYPLNGQWIMMDIDDGYILWTGIWKALGNSKADIVKMIDSQPDLAQLIRRVRGGYLKIQGTWMPYEVALRLSRRVAWAIRDDLVPLFGPAFPSTCLSPDQPGYGQVVASGPGRRRPRRITQPSKFISNPRDPHASWTIVTPGSGVSESSQGISLQPHSFPPFPSPYSDSRVPTTPVASSSEQRFAPTTGSSTNRVTSTSPIEYTDSLRYVSYEEYSYQMSRTQMNRAHHSGSRTLLPPLPRSPANDKKGAELRGVHITIPPIRPLSLDRDMSTAHFALPPISAMEDMRGSDVQDSASVLRRLRIDDDSHVVPSDQRVDGHQWTRRLPTTQSQENASKLITRFQPYHISPFTIDQPCPPPSRSHSTSGADSHYRHLGSESFPSHASRGGESTCEPSPVSPTTPHSAHPFREADIEVASSCRDQQLPISDRGSLLLSTEYHSQDFSSESRGNRKNSNRDDSDFTGHPSRPW